MQFIPPPEMPVTVPEWQHAEWKRRVSDGNRRWPVALYDEPGNALAIDVVLGSFPDIGEPVPAIALSRDDEALVEQLQLTPYLLQIVHRTAWLVASRPRPIAVMAANRCHHTKP
ncbi:hypothetical protein A8W25_16795 [Streptomyces sp. ERV7]|uniref:hypothetical protein n=1 Tax=Streptomyces sp. ERV7 TaxID=1322334 RepID=UPI0007F54B17|nr:hypothetical protein [Streptomyces sp. ERV7]OAR24113.1 hypothetical protein A8W25_16795 [Streptomyces sp. ERV7]